MKRLTLSCFILVGGYTCPRISQLDLLLAFFFGSPPKKSPRVTSVHGKTYPETSGPQTESNHHTQQIDFTPGWFPTISDPAVGNEVSLLGWFLSFKHQPFNRGLLRLMGSFSTCESCDVATGAPAKIQTLHFCHHRRCDSCKTCEINCKKLSSESSELKLVKCGYFQK